jgi:hypothetical protein
MMGRTAGILAFACLLVSRALAQAPDTAPVTGFEKLTIPLLAEGKPDAADSAVTGYLFKPPGAGPFATVILLHGCDGLEWKRPLRAGWRLLAGYAERYLAHGYAALVLDSFQPRGVDNDLRGPDDGLGAPPRLGCLQRRRGSRRARRRR